MNTGPSSMLRIEPRKGTKAVTTRITAKVRIMPVHKAGARLNRSQAWAIQVQPWLAGTGCPSATKLRCARALAPATSGAAYGFVLMTSLPLFLDDIRLH